MIIVNFIPILFSMNILLNKIIKGTSLVLNESDICANISWYDHRTIFANENEIDSNPNQIFIDENDNVYLTKNTKRFLIWLKNKNELLSISIDDHFIPDDIFVTKSNTIYLNDYSTGKIMKLSDESYDKPIDSSICEKCTNIFIDLFDNFYCSMHERDGVMRMSLKDNSNLLTVVAGRGFRGVTSTTLNSPRGIFVNRNQNLYVADSENDRIQLFRNGESVATTVIGSNQTFQLNYPTEIVLDLNNQIYVIDRGNTRLIRFISERLQCLIGCQKEYLNIYPQSLAFNTHGYLFITDLYNRRIYSFILSNHTCHRIPIDLFPINSTLIDNNITNQTIFDKDFRSTYSVELNESSSIYPDKTGKYLDYYKLIEISVETSGYYYYSMNGTVTPRATLEDDPYLSPNTSNIILTYKETCTFYRSQYLIDLHSDKLYKLRVSMARLIPRGLFSININGPNELTFKEIRSERSIYSLSNLTNPQQKNLIICNQPNFYAQIIQINVMQTGTYEMFDNNQIKKVVSIYEINDVNPMYTLVSVIAEDLLSFRRHLTSKSEYLLIYYTFEIFRLKQFSININGPDKVHFKSIEVPRLIRSSFSSEQKNLSRYAIYKNDFTGLTSYEAIEISVNSFGLYIIEYSMYFDITTRIFLYENHFNPFNIFNASLVYNRPTHRCPNQHTFIQNFLLKNNTKYLLVFMGPSSNNLIENFSLIIHGPKIVQFNRIKESVYSSILTEQNQVYMRECGKGNYYYETIEINIKSNGYYSFAGLSQMKTFVYLYKNQFDPFDPEKNLIEKDGQGFSTYQFTFSTHLFVNQTSILLVTTANPNEKGSFSIIASGPNLIHFHRKIFTNRICVIGDRCNAYVKGIGLILDDILHNEIKQNSTIAEQPLIIKLSISITILMLICGLISSILSLITFQSKHLRQTGCGIYLYVSSITSLFTICFFSFKFTFVILSGVLVETINRNIHHVGCVSFEVVLKFFLYFDGWLNSCVAIERIMNIVKGTNFNKKKSRYFARRIIVCLILFVLLTFVHEPIYRRIFEYEIGKYILNQYQYEKRVLCIVRYSKSLDGYNTFILFFHTVVPFLLNLFSSLFIIFGIARQRAISKAQDKLSFKQHLIKQFHEHRHLLISSIVLIILCLPRLIISLSSGCTRPSDNPWLYLSAYYISFFPSILIFIIFVISSEMYKKQFHLNLQNIRRKIGR